MKKFNGKEILISEIKVSDAKKVKKFQDFIGFLVTEGAQILVNKKPSLKEEKVFLNDALKNTKNKKEVFLFAEHQGKIIATTSVRLERYRKNHIGRVGIAVRNGYRGMGLGQHLMLQVMKLAKNKLKPKPKFIQLEVYTNNKPAINLYKKIGFNIVVKIPKQLQSKGKLIDELIMMLNV